MTPPALSALAALSAFDPIEPRERYEIAIAKLEEDLDNAAVLEVVYSLPVLAVHVLAIASGPTYAGSVPINRLDHAVILLGREEVCRLANALYSRALSVGPMPDQIVDLRELIDQATLVSRAAARIAQATRLPLAEEARTVGLLLDLGIGYQLREHPVLMRRAVEDAKRAGGRLLEHERIHLGTDHCETLKTMLLEAGVHPDVATVVEYHHDPLSAPAPQRYLAAIVYAAYCLALRERKPTFSTESSLIFESTVLTELRLSRSFFDEHSILLGDERPAEPAATDAVDETTATAKPHILCVDDNERNLLILDELLGDEYRLTMVASGEEALASLTNDQPDLILLDVMMKGIDGVETCRRIKVDPKTGGIPVVLVTALSSDDERGRGLAAGADAYVVKPFDPDRLLDTIDRLLPRTAPSS